MVTGEWYVRIEVLISLFKWKCSGSNFAYESCLRNNWHNNQRGARNHMCSNCKMALSGVAAAILDN